MAVLLRSPSGKVEIYAKEFGRAGVPLVVERGGFYDSSEILDLLSLLQLLDNPLQDVPAIAVLRSPLVACRSTNWRRSGWRQRTCIFGRRLIEHKMRIAVAE